MAIDDTTASSRLRDAPASCSNPSCQRPPRRRTTTQQSLREKRRKDRTASTLSVDFCIPTSFRSKVSRDWILRVSTQALWKHVVYSRGLLPMTVDQILLHESDGNVKEHSRRPCSMQRQTARKLSKVRSSLEQFMADCNDVFSSLDIHYVLLQIGSSWARPKEAYLLDFNRLNQSDTSTNDSMTTEAYTLSTRLVRQFVTAECLVDSELSAKELLASTRRSTSDRLYATFGVRDQSFERLFPNKSSSGTQEQSPAESSNVNVGEGLVLFDDQALLHKLILRRDFAVADFLSERKRHTMQRLAHIRVQERDTAREAASDPSSDSNNDMPWQDLSNDNVVWLSLRSTINGFRMK